MMRRSILYIAILILLLPAAAAQDYYSVRKHGRISTALDEAVAIPYKDGIVYITQPTSIGASAPTTKEGERLFTMFYYKESTGQKKPFIESLVTTKHEGPVSFTADFNTMVFCQQRSSAENRDFDPLKLFFAENVDGQWTNIREFEHNDEFAWLFSPALSGDGRTLFFAANFPDGEGGFDLYRSKLKSKGWTEPENLGPGVNTAKDELYPFIHPSGRLCFSSDGHDRVGGFDLFESRLINGKWSGAIKLMAPFNTLSDDYHAWFSDDLKSGYLTSNRRSGSKEIWTFQTDIPNFERPDPIKKTYYKYRIFDKKLDTVNHELFRYSWTINDTLEIPGHDVIYRFPEPGTYVCRLNVYDINLDTLLEGQTIRTLRISLNEQTVIICPDTIRVNNPVLFDGRETHLPGVDIDRFIWDFGDGNYGQGITNEHTYRYPGRYRVILGIEERKKNRRADSKYRSNFRDVVVLAED